MKPLLSDILPLNQWLADQSDFLKISGPCSAETPEQVHAVMQNLAALPGLHFVRFGVWKPRTRPNSFEGNGKIALAWLRDAAKGSDLKQMIEVADAQHVEAALEAGIEALWIGARTTVNPFSVQSIADALRGVDVPVFVKNPISPDLPLWLGALERVHASGIRKLVAVHRGFTSYDAHPYRNAARWEIPLQLKGMIPELPVICDPSHIAGRRDLVPEVAQKALDFGMQGLMVESHPNPEAAWSDAAQQLNIQDLPDFWARLEYSSRSGASPEFNNRLWALRKLIDSLDEDLLNVLARRMEYTREIGQHKAEHNITLFQLERWNEILETRTRRAGELGLDADFIRTVWMDMHQRGLEVQAKAVESLRKTELPANGSINS